MTITVPKTGRKDFIRGEHVERGPGERSAKRLTDYLTRREVRELQDGSRIYETVEPISGDREAFESSVQERLDGGGRKSREREQLYLHIVVSPPKNTLIRDEDLGRISEIWTKNRNGKEVEHLAVVHRDTDDPHMHIALARGRMSRREYEEAQELSRQIIAEREREVEHDKEQEVELRKQLERDMDTGREYDREHEEEMER